jgi:hypothetical protein
VLLLIASSFLHRASAGLSIDYEQVKWDFVSWTDRMAHLCSKWAELVERRPFKHNDLQAKGTGCNACHIPKHWPASTACQKIENILQFQRTPHRWPRMTRSRQLSPPAPFIWHTVRTRSIPDTADQTLSYMKPILLHLLLPIHIGSSIPHAPLAFSRPALRLS